MVANASLIYALKNRFVFWELIVSSPGNGDIGLLQRDLRGAYCGVYRLLDALAKFGATEKEKVFLLTRRNKDIVFVLSFFPAAIFERCYAITVFFVVVPFALVLQPVRSLRNTYKN